MEVVASGLPFGHGVPVAVNATLVSAIHANGEPYARADVVPGVALKRAEKRKRENYPELVDSPVLCLATVAHETGGRFNETARKLLDAAAAAKVRSLPAVLQPSAARAWRARWTTMLSTCVQTSLAATLVNTGTTVLDAADGVAPTAVDVWLGSASLSTFGQSPQFVSPEGALLQLRAPVFAVAATSFPAGDADANGLLADGLPRAG